jgi:hypothetical protein
VDRAPSKESKGEFFFTCFSPMSSSYSVKKVSDFPIPIAGTSRLETGKSQTFFTVQIKVLKTWKKITVTIVKRKKACMKKKDGGVMPLFGAVWFHWHKDFLLVKRLTSFRDTSALNTSVL